VTSSRETVLAALAKGHAAWAVLDGARDRRIASWLVKGVPCFCLYRGPLVPELASAAPYLLRLAPGHELTERFFKLGWSSGWGIALSSNAPQKVLYRHLRKLLRARGPSGRSLLFRWYDPAVASVLLPGCTEEELAKFLGPISALAVPGDEPRVFRATQEMPLRGPFEIREEQMQALGESRRRRFEERVAQSLRARFPSVEEPLALVQEGVRRAGSYGIAEESSVEVFIDWMAKVSPDFDRREDLQPIFSHPRLPAPAKLDLVRARMATRRA
jgi:Domain of unknown function (DUF4123)